MFKIIKSHMHEDYIETLSTTDDPCEAYELAHGYDSDFADEPVLVAIVNEDGVDMWAYCARMRCGTGQQYEYNGKD